MSKVSVILPVFNGGEHLSVALASLMLQDYRDLEIIVIDDGSTDRSAAIIDAAAARDGRFRVIRRANRGLIQTLNEGLSNADSDFVARMDADDIAYPGRIGAQVRAFAEDPALGLHGCNFDTLFTPRRARPATEPEGQTPEDLAILSHFFTILRHPTVMFRRSRLPPDVLAYDAGYPHAEDFDLFRRVARHASVRQGTEPMLAYRLHPESVSVRHEEVMQRTHLRILEEEMALHFPALAGTGVESIADRVDAQSVAAASEFIRRFWWLIAASSGQEARVLHIAGRTCFYLLFSMIANAGDYRLGCDFADATGRWDLIRRRERLLLRISQYWRGLAVAGYEVHYGQLGVAGALASTPVSRIVPDYPRISALAERLDAEAR